MKKTNEDKSARIISILVDRKGFDDWWFNIGKDIQEEIFLEIVGLLKED